MAGALGAKLYTVEEAAELDASQVDLIGIGSGIYFYRHHQELRRLVASWPKVPKRCCPWLQEPTRNSRRPPRRTL